jgi:GT2 family glycosyltransferase
MVVSHPGSWFDQTLDALARQDYPDLKTLVLVDGGDDVLSPELAERITARLPGAFIERTPGPAGFGPTANGVLRLVDGDNGFFCFLHDDVALDPSAIRLLVEEMYRSNAGIVGPKLVEWHDARVLQHVGFGADRFGEIDPIVERGEVDQEQHDGVRDVFGVPSACMLVRADLFRTLDGFDRAMPFHGEDLDLCWRAHRSGARVVVVPAARARHREALQERRPDLAHETLRARHRMRSALTLSSARRLPLLVVELALLTIVELVVGLFTGRARSGIAGVRALVGVVPRSFGFIARRRALRPTRHVPDAEVSRLQQRGSARFAAFLRSRDVRPDRVESGRGWRERAGGTSVIAWACLLIALVVGARELITGGVPPYGDFLPLGDSPRRLLRSYMSEWSGHGVGASRPAPTGLALVAVASIGTAFRMGLLHTVATVGLVLVGCLGIWRMSSAFTTNRGRIVALAAYAGVLLPGQAISVGRWGPLVCYAALPWLVDSMRRFAGIDSARAAAEPELVVHVAGHRRVSIAAAASLIAAIATAFEPSFAFLLLAVTVVFAVATLLSGVHWSAGLNVALLGAIATLVGLALNLPWVASYVGDGGWTAIVGPGPPGDRGNTVLELASFDIGTLPGALLSLALYLPVLAAPLLGRGWRYGWAIRGGALVGAFLWLAVLDDSGSFLVRLPEPGIVLVPVAVGLAIAAGCAAAAFELDVRGGRFGWRQPLGLVASVAVVVGILPGLFGLSSGRWEAPTTTMVDLLQLAETPDEGDFRVLWLGDERIVPVAGQTYRPGIAYALTDGTSLDVADTWAVRPEPADDTIVAALDAIATGSTARAGRLLAPFAVRYIVIPVAEGAVSVPDDPLPLPTGLLDALGDQLDLSEIFSPRSNYIAFENTAWIPSRSVLTNEGAEASRLAGATAIAQADATGATPVMRTADEQNVGRAELPAGTLHVSEPFDEGWTLQIEGVEVPGRPAFGSTTAFDVEQGGSARLSFEGSSTRVWLLAAQAIGWVLVFLGAINVRVPHWGRRRRRGRDDTEPLIALEGTDVLPTMAAPVAVPPAEVDTLPETPPDEPAPDETLPLTMDVESLAWATDGPDEDRGSVVRASAPVAAESPDAALVEPRDERAP